MLDLNAFESSSANWIFHIELTIAIKLNHANFLQNYEVID